MDEYVEIYGGNGEHPVNMRTRPATGSALVDQIPQHTKVQFLEDGGSWVKVKYGKKNGWVMATFVHAGEKADTAGDDNPEDYQSDGAVILTLTYAQAVALLPILDSLTEQVVQKVGRG